MNEIERMIWTAAYVANFQQQRRLSSGTPIYDAAMSTRMADEAIRGYRLCNKESLLMFKEKWDVNK